MGLVSLVCGQQWQVSQQVSLIVVNKRPSKKVQMAVCHFSSRTNFLPYRYIGKGIEGSTIEVGYSKFESNHYAQKICYSNRITSKSLWMKEDLLRQISNEKMFIPLYGAFREQKKIYLIMELADSSLYSKIKLKQALSQQSLKVIGLQIANALEYLHSKNIIYGQLRPENVLIGNDKRCKLSQYIFSTFLVGESKTINYIGARQYTAPEIIQQQPYTQKIDIWNFGVLMYELATLSLPYFNEGGQKNNKIKGLIEQKYSKQFKSLIECCLSKQPQLRIDIKTLKQHQFFTKQDMGVREHTDEVEVKIMQGQAPINQALLGKRTLFKIIKKQTNINSFPIVAYENKTVNYIPSSLSETENQKSANSANIK